MKVGLHKASGGWERIHIPKDGLNLGMEVMDYMPKKLITSLAHALILPPTNIGYESQCQYVSQGKLTASIPAPSAWFVGGHLVSPQSYREALAELDSNDRYLIDVWLSNAKEKYTIGRGDATSFIQERLGKMEWDEIREEALALGGLKKTWKTAPLFRRHMVTDTGLAFWRLALLLNLNG